MFVFQAPMIFGEYYVVMIIILRLHPSCLAKKLEEKVKGKSGGCMLTAT